MAEMDLIATVMILSEETTAEDLVPPGLVCPGCGENRMDWIQPLDDGRFACLRCSTCYEK
jgi:hypothetical protein